MKAITITSVFLSGNLENFCNDNNIPILKRAKKIENSIVPKYIHLLKLIVDFFFIIKHIRTIRKFDTIISVGYLSFIILILKKVGVLKNVRIVWVGFFLHNKKYFNYFKFIFKILLDPRVSILVYSRYEIQLYSSLIGIPSNQIEYLPLIFDSNFFENDEFENKVILDLIPKEYYFSGGYSDRDYLTLINVFRNIKEKLVICCSYLNHEIDNIETTSNIIILRDLTRNDFNSLLKKSKACILLIKSNLGAAGQLFALEAMYNSKLLLSSSTHILNEIVEDEKTGLVIENPYRDLPNKIKRIEGCDFEQSKLILNAKNKVLKNHSRYEFDTTLTNILNHSIKQFN
nr:glycosyltransferase [uncultured Emticicia sp.]